MFGNDCPAGQPVQQAVTFCLGALSSRRRQYFGYKRDARTLRLVFWNKGFL